MLHGRHIVLGVSGGIAAYKAVDLCRRLVEAGAFVSPILTESATHFIGPATFAAVASEQPRLTLWNSPEPSPHTTLGQRADLIIVAPATARVIGAYAVGIADDLLTTTLLATRAPVLLAPAMHTEMWEHPAVVANIATLRDRHVTIVDPEAGSLAGGDVGVGRLASTEAIIAALPLALSSQTRAPASPDSSSQTRAQASDLGSTSLVGKTVLITAGGTREPIDPVRFIGNRSSGRQGYAIAQVAAARGAKVILVTAARMKAPEVGTIIKVNTADEMNAAVMEQLPSADIVVLSAAVADFKPSNAPSQKIKKESGVPSIELEPTVDIAEQVAQKRTKNQIVVGFAAETNDLEANAKLKLERKSFDLIVANDVSQDRVGFDHETNSAIILDKKGRKYETGLTEKRTVAAKLFDFVLNFERNHLE